MQMRRPPWPWFVAPAIVLVLLGACLAAPDEKAESKPPVRPRPSRGKPKQARIPIAVTKLESSVAVVQGKGGHGSGFVVLPNVVATNAHVIRDDFIKDVLVRFIAPNAVAVDLKAELLFEDKSLDLAFLLIQPKADQQPLGVTQPLKLDADFVPGKGKPVYVIGSPAQAVKQVARVNVVAPGTTDGIVMLNRKPFIQIKVLVPKVTIEVGPGNSGGPVLDPAGQVIGVLTAGVTKNGKPVGQHFCVPGHAVKSALEGLGPSGDWNERIRKATARHVFDIAVAHCYLNAKVARNVLDDRVAIANKGGPTAFLADQSLIKAFKEIDKSSQQLAQPALQLVLGNKDIPQAQMRGLLAMRDNLRQIRSTVARQSVSASEFKLCRRAIDQYDKYFNQVKEGTGLTDEILKEMLMTLIHSLARKIPG